MVEEVTKEIAQELGLIRVEGLAITEVIQEYYDLAVSEGAWLKGDSSQLAVVANSPADKVGLKEGDIITKINNQAVNTENTVSAIISQYKVGDTLSVTYLRDSQEKTAQAVLELSPEE